MANIIREQSEIERDEASRFCWDALYERRLFSALP